MKKRIMFYCHYSLGLGHFVRTIALAKGINKVNPDSEILIVAGGAPVPIKLPEGIKEIKILNLPPLRESKTNRELESTSNNSLQQVKRSRILKLIKAYRLFNPDFLFVDHFPFGRMELKDEITALLDIAVNSNQKPKIISSIRDMAFVEKDYKEETGQMIEYFLNKYFDYLLVHSDSKVICIEDEFEILKKIKIPIIYTGYVCSMSEEEIKKKINSSDTENRKLILVSAGGGRNCFELIKKTIEAKEKLDKKEVKSRFLILTGPFLSEEEFSSLKGLAEKHTNIILKRFIPNFIDVLKQADVSISNVGYNTITELLLTKTKALLIPHIKNSVINKEQLERAKKIKNIIPVEILDPRELSPVKMADCLNQLMNSKPNQDDIKQFDVDLSGAEFTGEFISNLNKPCRVFFRDDDVHEVTDKFVEFNNLFSDKKIPIHYSVIPYTMSENLIEHLNNLKKKQCIEIGQHGWSHKKHGDSVSYEFGDKRSYSEQYEDISKGRNKIESNFGINPNLVFTPPHNRLNSDTIMALKKLDFRIISSSCYSYAYNKIKLPQKIRDIPICLDLFVKIDGKWILKDKRELIKEFLIKKQNGIVGIMCHHKFFNDKKEFGLLNEFIDFLIREKAQFKSIAQINRYLDKSEKTIAYLRSNFLPVSENFIYTEIKNINQSDLGYDATVISVVRKNEEIFSGVEVIAQPRFNSLHTANYPFIKNSQLKLYKQFMDYCADEIISRNVSLLHAQFGDDGLFFLPLKRKTGLPLVVSFRGFDLYRLPNKSKELYNPLFKEADLFLVRSNSMKKDLIDLGCPAEKINVHHSSIDLDEIDAILNEVIRVNAETKKDEKRVNEKIKLIFAGRFVEKKGILDIIKAFSKLRQNDKNIELKLIGDGPLRKQAEKLVSDLGIKDVIFINFLSHEDFIREMKKADIFVLPSKTAKDGNKEGIPVVLMEAMASYVIVVASDHSGIPEIVKDNKTGLIFKEGDVIEASKKLNFAIENLDGFESIKKNARLLVEKDFNVLRQTSLLEQIYDKLLDRNVDALR